MNKRALLFGPLLSALLFGCGKSEDNSRDLPGLENEAVFATAQVQVPFNSVYEAVRGVINPESEPFLSSDAKNLATQLQTICEISEEALQDETDENKVVRRFQIRKTAEKSTCPISFTETWEELKSGVVVNQGASYRVSGRLQAVNNALSIQGITSIKYNGAIQQIFSSSGSLNAVNDRVSGMIGLASGKTAKFSRTEKSKFSVASGQAQKLEAVSMRTNLVSSAAWLKTRKIINGAVTSETNIVNGKAVTKAQSQKLSGAKIQAW